MIFNTFYSNFFLIQEGLSVKYHYIGLSIVFSSSMLETIDNWRYLSICNMCCIVK